MKKLRIKTKLSLAKTFFGLFTVIFYIPTFLIAQVQPFKSSENMNIMDHGPFISSTITHDPLSTKDVFVHKGIAVKVGENPNAIMVFDTDLLRMSNAWTGGTLRWNMDERNGLEYWPTPEGTIHFENGNSPGWSQDKTFNDPRTWPYGPVPKSQGHYNGLYIHNKKVLLSYNIGENEILENPGFELVDTYEIFTRTFRVNPANETLSLRICRIPEGGSLLKHTISNSTSYLNIQVGKYTRTIGMKEVPDSAKWRISNHHLILDLPKMTAPYQFKILIGSNLQENGSKFMQKHLMQISNLPDLLKLKQSGHDNWETIVTTAVQGNTDGAFAIDELTLPEENPWHSYIRLTDVDFLPDGRAVVASISGDIWLVEGIKENLGKLRWHRFATGLFQPLGVKVVKNQIYVTGRDQITRLQDFNNDGFADFYENFNNDVMASTNFHAFNMNLETDSAGNFYFAKSTPWPPYVRGEGLPKNEEITPHQGILFKLSPDGKQLERIATGLRNPNGLCITPEGEMIYADNEGNWVPTSKIHRIKPMAFHGFIPSSHQADLPDSFEPPMVWIPHHMDNSPSKPVYISSKKWPDVLRNNFLLLSYGRANLSLILNEEVDGIWQGAHISLPYMLKSGLERGRFHSDGHLYIVGMTSWQSIGQDWGSFSRVRYTGENLELPVSIKTKPGGLEITFSEPVNPEEASNTKNYKLQKWTYPWTRQYGTRGKLYSIDNPGQAKPDMIEVNRVIVSENGKSIFIEIPELKPGKINTTLKDIETLPEMIEASLGMVVSINYKISTKAGTPINHLIHKTIHNVPSPKSEN